MNKRNISFVLLLAILFVFSHESCTQRINSGVVAFYNLENLFDTINSPGVRDGEFTPSGSKEWTAERYWEKIGNLGRVVSMIGEAEGFEGPSVIGMCEMENLAVLEDLVNSSYLKDKNYKIVHYDSPDKRGIDVALLYKSNEFKVTSSRSVPLIINVDGGGRLYTRDQLVVSGLFCDEPMHFIVNHWPSRFGGQERSKGPRVAAARLTRSLVDSILVTDVDAKIVVMGDLNDDPTDESVRLYLKSRHDKNRLKPGQLFNATEVPFRQGKGTLAYGGKWNMFDQLILTQPFVDRSKGGFKFHSAQVFTDSLIVQNSGKYKGYPYRSYVGKSYMGGYSDHFPVYMLLFRED